MAKKREEVGFSVWLTEQIFNEYPWTLLIFLLPISLVYDFVSHVAFLIGTLYGKSKESHEAKVKDVQRQVRRRIETGDRRQMCTARPGWKSITLQQLNYKSKCYQVKINMSNVLSLDVKNRKVTVEPMVTIGELNDYLISQGWTLPVVPELNELTIGGLVMGGGIESTSNKYGLFQYICSAYELVLADGSVILCNKDQHQELYVSIPFSYGSFGFLTSVEIDIIPYKPYLKLTYKPIRTKDDVVDEFSKVVNDNHADSIEELVFSQDSAVLMTGYFVDGKGDESVPINHMGRYYTEWFYTYVRKMLDRNEPYTELIPTKDFFHRHNKSWFWLLEETFGSLINHRIFRYTLGWTMPPKFSFIKFLRQRLVRPNMITNFVCQDFGYELKDLKKALEFIDQQTKVYPIWLCPMRHCIQKELESMVPFNQKHVHIDVGIYGFSKIPGFDTIACQKVMEKYALENDGLVALYAETQLSFEDFKKMFKYTIDVYYKVRREYKAEGAFPEVYEKISKLGRGPMN